MDPSEIFRNWSFASFLLAEKLNYLFFIPLSMSMRYSFTRQRKKENNPDFEML